MFCCGCCCLMGGVGAAIFLVTRPTPKKGEQLEEEFLLNAASGATYDTATGEFENPLQKLSSSKSLYGEVSKIDETGQVVSPDSPTKKEEEEEWFFW